MYGYMSWTSIILSLLAFFITMIAQLYVMSSYKKYKTIKTKKGLTGFEVARMILDKNGLKDVHVVETKGNLTDHYDPTRKVIKLSTEIFNGTTIASNAVAAHEVGHAIQDKEGYGFMKIRSLIVPVVNFCSKIGYIVVVIGFIFSMLDLVYVGIGLLVAMLVFQLITLPVEFNASNKAKENLDSLKILDESESLGCKSMLNAAASTYVASLASTLLELLRLFLMARDRN
ncbi:MAG: zinc metallopeptidase [bacterium]|nr:zinc metallopeptidase [bacterium]